MAVKKNRVYFPLGSEYYMESPWVETNGRRSFEPTTDQPKIKLADVVREAEQKGDAVIDCSMCISDCYSGSKPANYEGKVAKGGMRQVEQDQIELGVTATAATAVIRVGLAPAEVNLGIFGTTDPSTDVTVTGTLGADTLKVIGRLAHYGHVKLRKIHIDADDEAFFGTTPLLKQFNHTGRCVKEETVHYPKASAEDDNPTIRVFDEKYMDNKDIVLSGMNFLQINIPNGEAANISLYTEFWPKQ